MKSIVGIILSLYMVNFLISEFVYPRARLFFYVLPVIIIGLSIFSYRYKFDHFNLSLLKLGLIPALSFIPIIWLSTTEIGYLSRYSTEFLLIFPVLLMCVYIKKYVDHDQLDKYFGVLIIILFVIFIIAERNSIIKLFSSLASFFLYSISDTETTYAPVYGVIAIYFFIRKKYRYFAIAALLTIVASKRIVVAALFGALLGGYIVKRLKLKPSTVTFLAVVVNFIFVILLINLSQGVFNDDIRRLTGLSANHFFMGRVNVYSITLDKFEPFTLLGSGLGSTSYYLRTSLFAADTANLIHSDILKLFIETGMLLFTAYLFTLYNIAKRSPNSIFILLYINILYLTGNTMIFVHVNIIVYLILTAIYKLDEINYSSPKTIQSNN